MIIPRIPVVRPSVRAFVDGGPAGIRPRDTSVCSLYLSLKLLSSSHCGAVPNLDCRRRHWQLAVMNSSADDNNSQNPEEECYLSQVRNIIKHGTKRQDRTGVGTLALFGLQGRYSLRNDSFPLLTTKRVFWKGIVEELLWFISGSTNVRELSSKGVRIWDGNSSRDFLDKRGLHHYAEGDVGPVYGFQWRHFGAKYESMYNSYAGKGIDQLQKCIDMIKTDPQSRRIVMTAWNPCDLDLMALPPCHCFVQFFVADDELSCQMYQRSADMGLGVPFNVASYALLTRMVAHVTGLRAGEFIHIMGDAHVYMNHIEALSTQIERKPRRFPKLRIVRDVKSIDDFLAEDFQLIDYNPHDPIRMSMAV
uniref:Thymidylate synthase n=1 Tax=Trichuris muris TaxID=70415 RepID=A0A5S6Q5S0_TRIMR